MPPTPTMPCNWRASEHGGRSPRSIRSAASDRGSCASSPTRLAINDGRGWRRHRAELRVASRSVGDATDAADLVTADEREVVVAALNRLDAMERLVIALRHFEQLTELEMADVLDCPTGTVKSRLSRAMSRLRAELTMEAFGDG